MHGQIVDAALNVTSNEVPSVCYYLYVSTPRKYQENDYCLCDILLSSNDDL